MNHLSTQNVNIARFARNVECDFLGDFQHCVLTSKYFKFFETHCSKLSVEVKGKVAVPIKVFSLAPRRRERCENPVRIG